MEPLTVVIVDDHPLAREGLRAMLESTERVQVIGEAGDGLEALDLVPQLHPDVTLMDVQMPQMDGIEATRRIIAVQPSSAIILISAYDDEAQVINGVMAGAAGYLLKDVSRDVLADAVAAVVNGFTFINKTVLQRAVERLFLAGQSNVPAPAPPRSAQELTLREMDVLKHLANGQSNKEIAGALSLADVTVKKHVQRIMAKLNVCDRTQAAIVALRTGLIE